MMLTQMPKIGDRLRFIGDADSYADIIYGKEYVVTKMSGEGKYVVIYDELDEPRYISEDSNNYELVTEPSEPTPVEASPTVIELLANISRRLYEAERTIKEQAYEINELYKAVAERG